MKEASEKVITPEHIRYFVCPECGAPYRVFGREVSREGEIRRHCAGGIWEFIEFACGRRDEFVPNFGRIQTKNPCQNSSDIVARKRRRVEARASVIKHILSLDVDEEFRADLKRHLEWSAYD